MDNQLKPCPFCGSDDTYTDSALGKRQVLCNACEASGPTEETDDEAIASWNRLAAPVAPAAAPSALASLVEFNPEHPLLANAEPPEEVWSADRETFDCDSLGELLDSNELEIGQTVYVGEKVPVDATSYIEVEILLDSLGDRAFDHVGEAADGYPDVSQEARDELEALLSAWVQKNAKPNFYRVKKIREYTITQQDIEDATQGAAQ